VCEVMSEKKHTRGFVFRPATGFWAWILSLNLLLPVPTLTQSLSQANAPPGPRATSQPAAALEHQDQTAATELQRSVLAFDNDLSRAERLRHADQLDSAEALFREVLSKATTAGDRNAQARAYAGIESILNRKAKYLDARSAAQSALLLYASLQNAEGQARMNHELAKIAHNTGDDGLARDHYAKALQGYEALGLLREKISLHLDSTLSVADDDEKLRILQEALRESSEFGDQSLEARTSALLGDAWFRQGNLDAAQEGYSRAAALYRGTGDKRGLARVLTSEGRLQRAHGHPDKALPFYLQALQLQREIGDQQGAIQSINAMAVAYEHLDNYARAIELLEQALAMAKETGSPKIINFELGNLADDYAYAGRNQEAITILEDLVRQGLNAGVAMDRYGALSTAYMHLGRLSEAAQAAGKAVEIARAENDMDSLPDAILGKAEIEEKQSDLPAALADAQELLRTIEELRSHVVPTDFMKRGFGARAQDAFTLYVRLLIESQQAGRALEVAEEGRSRAFLDLLATRQSGMIQGRQIASLYPAQRQAMAGAPASSRPEPGGWAGILTRGSSVDNSSVWNRWSSSEATLHSLVSAQPFSLRQIQGTTQRLNSTLLSYWVAPDATYIWVLDPMGAVHSACTPVSAKRLEELISSLWPGAHSRAAKTRTIQPHNSPEPAKVTAAGLVPTRGGSVLKLDPRSHQQWHELYRILIEPVEAWLPPEGALITVEAHGPLMILPFAALRDSQGRYLLERYALHYTPTLSLLGLTEAREPEKTTANGAFLLVGDPLAPSPLPALPGARREVSAVARLLAPSQAVLLEGSQATASRVTELAVHSRVIHLATHGVIVEDQPFDSYLAFTPGGSGDARDGKLTAARIYDLELHADLIFLSACRSGLGPVRGDGVAGLTRAFLYAGTPSVIVSLWDVADEPTYHLVPRFYQTWLRGETKAAALRSAQLRLLRMLRRGEVKVHTFAGELVLSEDPVFWAGFVLQGNP
jgi:CHAT domain-containing protein/tetratricopeptide (TPR) repeat protein